MRNTVRSILLAATFVGAPWLLAAPFLSADADVVDQVPPEEGQPEKKSKASARDDHESLHRKLEEESKANLKEISRLMEKVQESLSRKQTGDPTQNDQREVVKRIEELIDKIGKG